VTTDWTSGLLAAALEFAGAGFDQRVSWRAGGWQCQMSPEGFVLSGPEGSLRCVVPGVDLAALSDRVDGDSPPAVVAPAGRTADRPPGLSPVEVDHGPALESGAELEQPKPAAALRAVSEVRRRRLSEGEDVPGWRPLFPLPLH
jgi:hypothetical protein